MQIPIDKQVAFFDWQVKEHQDEFARYLNASMKLLFEGKEAFIARIWGIDERKGNLILRFKQGFCPRLNYPLQVMTYSGALDNQGNPYEWSFTYKVFREQYSINASVINPIFYLKGTDPEWRYIGCSGVSLDFLDKISYALKHGQKMAVVLAEQDPPIQYLLNLSHFASTHTLDSTLNTSLEKGIDEWKPTKLNIETDYSQFIDEKLQENQRLIIQGPPGTGKSYLVAQITAQYLSKGRSVCITALTNKALMEVAEKPGFSAFIKKGKVFKTNLTTDEEKIIPDLNRASSLKIGPGELLLSTYYKLSEWYSDASEEGSPKVQVYDLVIIEEASQSFLATIAAFQRLGKEVLIVGDPLQLQPIVLNENSGVRIHPKILSYARGLEAFAANSSVSSYRLIGTRRLSKRSAFLTGMFYDNELVSIKPSNDSFNIKQELSLYIHEEGGTIIKNIPLVSGGEHPSNAFALIDQIISSLIEKNPQIKVAVLSPFKRTVKALQDLLESSIDDFSNLTVETIDRIQGLTVDYTILLIPMINPSFAFALNRFNVATSRSKTTTLIIVDPSYKYLTSIDPKVKEYLKESVVV